MSFFSSHAALPECVVERGKRQTGASFISCGVAQCFPHGGYEGTYPQTVPP